MAKKTILVTGAHGFIGQTLIRKLLEAGHSVTGVDINPLAPDKVPEGDYRQEILDADDLDALSAALGRTRPDVVISLAEAVKGPATGYPALSAAILEGILAASAAAGVKRVCFASSLAVYLGLPGPHSEDMPLPIESPLHIAAMKKAQEIVGNWHDRNGDMEVVAMRLGHIYGPRYVRMWNSLSRHLFGAMGRLRDDLPGLDAQIYDALSDYCHVDDCATGIALIATAPSLQHRVYNIGSGHAGTDNVIRAAVDIATGKSNNPPPEPSNRNYMDISRLSNELGFTPEHDVVSGIRAYHQWLQTNSL